ncbi:IS3 family transposase, partial [Staphylococcus pseudintermedius]|nr:IS3 family transposase [Staphylococcus pseudintermedius]MCE5457111.1 IS3 family transposase [Staphylococcus pseudintermedius]MCE5515651.1 IS3 family transposase [Staphylococcus pseudintermedius]MCE5713181.1 IS3 family transposase [Staphylococcus pseudintermedius]MCE5736881.1 IS3 family transposase [Staphylococcus pseudintermedius]
FHSIIKKKLIYHQNYKIREEAMFSIVAYLLTFYNSKRVHSTLNDMSPIEFEKKYATKPPSSECTFWFLKVHSELGKQAKRGRILFFLCPYS